MSSFDTYSLFLALKNHFTQPSYDYFKYHGKTNASPDSFMARRDRFQFQKLSRKVNAGQMKDFIVANLLSGKSWVGDFLEDDAYDIYLAYAKRKQSFSYVFADELDRLFREYSPETAFKIRDNQIPPILTCLMNGTISPETFAILNHFIGFCKVFDERLDDDYIWTKYRSVVVKLYPFLEYDKKKILQILKEKINEYSTEEQEARGEKVGETEEVSKS
jgi:hypothetical protein